MRQNVESDSQQPPAEPTKEESRPSEGLTGPTNEVEQEIKYKKISSFRQIYLMVKKNFLITFRKTNFMMFHLLTLTLISVIIVLINYITNTALKNQGDLIYPMNEVLPIQKCSFADNCKSFGYIMIGTPEPWIDFTLAEISTKAKLDPKTDMVEIYKGNDFQYVLKNFKSLTPYQKACCECSPLFHKKWHFSKNAVWRVLQSQSCDEADVFVKMTKASCINF